MRNFILALALILLPAYMSAQVIKGKVLDKKWNTGSNCDCYSILTLILILTEILVLTPK
jgi:hypothetical protein